MEVVRLALVESAQQAQEVPLEEDGLAEATAHPAAAEIIEMLGGEEVSHQ